MDTAGVFALVEHDRQARRAQRVAGRQARQAAGLPKRLSSHGFAVAVVSAGMPLNQVQKWLGHARLTTTSICADAIGAEEKDIASRIWR